MKNKKTFNNLAYSITNSIFLLFAIYLLLYTYNATDILPYRIFVCLLFGSMCIFMGSLSILYGYHYWYLGETYIYFKKRFRKKIIINLEEIEKVEKAWFRDNISCSKRLYGYIIYSKGKKINVAIHKKRKLNDLQAVLSRFLA